MKHSFSSVHFTTLNSLALLWACIGHDFFQVNRELKKLLVASVGDDLQYHFERVAREKNQLILENEALGRNIAQLSEQLERMSIQCDVWRSKFLASRYFLFYFLVFALPDLLTLLMQKKKKWIIVWKFLTETVRLLIHYLRSGLSLLWMVIQ